MARSIDSHRPDCPCPVCARRREESVPMRVYCFRLPDHLGRWLLAQGGSAFVRGLLERERADQEGS